MVRRSRKQTTRPIARWVRADTCLLCRRDRLDRKEKNTEKKRKSKVWCAKARAVALGFGRRGKEESVSLALFNWCLSHTATAQFSAIGHSLKRKAVASPSGRAAAAAATRRSLPAIISYSHRIITMGWPEKTDTINGHVGSSLPSLPHQFICSLPCEKVPL